MAFNVFNRSKRVVRMSEEKTGKDKLPFYLYWTGITMFNIGVWHDLVFKFFKWLGSGTVITDIINAVILVFDTILWALNRLVTNFWLAFTLTGILLVVASILLSIRWGVDFW